MSLILPLPSQVAEEAKSEAGAERHPAPLHSGEQWGKEEQVPQLHRDCTQPSALRQPLLTVESFRGAPLIGVRRH